jgi:hypothetical protein
MAIPSTLLCATLLSFAIEASFPQISAIAEQERQKIQTHAGQQVGRAGVLSPLLSEEMVS